MASQFFRDIGNTLTDVKDVLYYGETKKETAKREATELKARESSEEAWRYAGVAAILAVGAVGAYFILS